MSSLLRSATACAVLFVAFLASVRADVVELTDGRKLEGVILSESPEKVELKFETGAVVQFPRSRVRSITKADWQAYVNKGDGAADPEQALEFYVKAKEINPTAPGLDEKIRQAKQLAAGQGGGRRLPQVTAARRKAEEAEVARRLASIMDVAQADAVCRYLEQTIAEKPYLCEPRIKLAEIYAREDTPEATVRQVETLVGLVVNDLEAYYQTQVPELVKAARKALFDRTARDSLSFDEKSQLLGVLAHFINDNGEIVPPGQFQERRKKLASPIEAFMAKVHLVENADGFVSLKLDSEIAMMVRRAEQWREGAFPVEFFFGSWDGEDVQWDLTEGLLTFQGSGVNIPERELDEDAVQLVAQSLIGQDAQDYTIRVDGSRGQDSIVVSAVAPDILILKSYKRAASGMGQDAGAVAFNEEIRWSPPPAEAAPAFSSPVPTGLRSASVAPRTSARSPSVSRSSGVRVRSSIAGSRRPSRRSSSRRSSGST